MSDGASKAMGALQRLAALGGPDRVVLPELVRLLGELAPFETTAMLWLGADHHPCDTFTNIEAPPDYFARYAERWFDREEGRFHPRQLAMQLDPALQALRVSDFTPLFGESELYDEIYRPARHHWIAALALRDGERPIGNLGMGRPPGAPDFSDTEMTRLRLARPYLIQALSWRHAGEGWAEGDTVEDEAAMLLVDQDGAILHGSAGAWRLLHAAAGLPADRRLLRDAACAWARPLLAGLCRRVAAAASGRFARPAREERVTAYGRFVLRAFAFEAPEGPPRKFAIQVEKRLPAALALFRSPRFRDLTAREQDIARMLTTGLSYPRIADALDLAPSTVVTHVRHLGDKLGVAGRDQIVGALVAA